jgi:orotate phosphoribosyltransferase
MPEDFDAIDALTACGALESGHFKLSSGRHSDTYIQCATLLKDPALALAAGRAIAEVVSEPVDAVLSPALGAVVIGFTTAAALGCESIFAERVDGAMTLRRGFEVTPGKRILLVEDVITTGGSILELARMVEDLGGKVVAMACIVQRGEIDTAGNRLVSIARLQVESFDPEECPLCAQGLPIDSPGSRFTR